MSVNHEPKSQNNSERVLAPKTGKGICSRTNNKMRLSCIKYNQCIRRQMYILLNLHLEILLFNLTMSAAVHL